MYLSKLEIFGFKSFAQKTVLKLTDGLTAIVGPNGCGKTNVVDAIRWVLGEQKTAVLRSDLMENVIFNGTKDRKPLGMSEVSITIQNNKQRLPLAFSEVQITRRLFRNGDSQYLLNNTQCRLKDIIDLFMDTGMGSDSYSVIELKMVEAILSGKPEERRHLFEEAAGVNKYKIRRKEATKKLLSVQQDLTRVQDIVDEVQKNVNTLSRQAAKTRKYYKLYEQLKEYEIELLKYDFQHFNNELNLIQNDLNEINNKKTTLESKIKDIEDTHKILSEKSKVANESYNTTKNQEELLSSQISSKNKDIAVANERIVALNNSQSRIEKEIIDAQNSIQNLADSLASTNEKIQELQTQKQESDSNYIENKEAVNEAAKIVAEFRENANSINEEIISIQNRLNTIKNSSNSLKNKKNSINNRINDSNNEIQKITNTINDTTQEETSFNEKIEFLSQNIANSEKELQDGRERQKTLQSELDKIQAEISQNKDVLSRKTASLELLSSLIDSDESTKFLLNSKEWQPKSEKILLSELVSADESLYVAINAALGEAGQYIVIDSSNESDSAFKILTDKKKGKVTLLSRDLIPNVDAPSTISCNDSIFGWASEILRVDDDSIRHALRAILGKTVLVDNIDTAKQLINKKICDKAVTLKGEIFAYAGFVRGGSVSQNEGRTVGKRERIRKLKKEIDEIKSILSGFNDNYTELKNELASIDLHKLADSLRQNENLKNQNDQKLTQIKYRLESLNNNLENHKKNLSIYTEELASLENEGLDFDTESEELFTALTEEKEKQRIAIYELKNAETNYELSNENARKTQIHIVRLDSEIKALIKDIDRINNTIDSTKNNIQNKQNEFDNNSKNIIVLQNNILENQTQQEALQLQFEETQNNCGYLLDEVKSLQEQLTAHSQEAVLLRKDYGKLVDNYHVSDLKHNEISIQSNTVITRAKEQYELDLESIEIIVDESFIPTNTRAAITGLREKLTELGNVNFMALEEYDAQNERLIFYERQMKDLVDSERILQETINEINNTAEEKFRDTFNKVNQNFQDLFKTLFGPEGEAHLSLADGSPLEADININAKPPGKRPHSIDMLSGGEKTLTAIALLFGIYLVKPSPFCILDEVDAPLDDSNVDKYIELIRKFSSDTQFMLVTHNRRTMESADTLYGITMQEEGVSKVVSVQLSDEEIQSLA